MKLLLALSCGLLVATAFADNAPKRVYIEPFTTKEGAEKLREDLTAELRRLNAISIVSTESASDLILDGGGEIWVRGYRSFSPRSEMKMSTNGTPLYSGYMSVELRNKQGITVWSYLATPEAASEDISKDLSRRIAKHLAEGLNQLPGMRAAARTHASVSLSAAGATFPFPVYEKWFANFRAEDPSVQISYDAIGSEAGVRKLLAQNIDFAASDSPEAIHDLAPGEENNYLFVPSVVGAVVPIVNLPGITADISFTPEALAGIFLGKIKKWNDPIIALANPKLHLPDLDIVVIHRADGSGTSYAWTEYLSHASPEWKSQVGSGLVPKWPVGRGATGNEGVAQTVKELGGSIGYVEYVYALRNHLSYGKVRNRNNEFVAADLESIAAAVNHSTGTSMIDAPGEGSYPISTFTWLVVPTHIADETKRTAITSFLQWMLGPGQRQAAALGYLALPAPIVTNEQEAISGIR